MKERPAKQDFRNWEEVAPLAGVPFVVLDDCLCILTASPSFYQLLKPGEVAEGELLYAVNDALFNISALRGALEDCLTGSEITRSLQIQTASRQHFWVEARCVASAAVKRFIVLSMRPLPAAEEWEHAELPLNLPALIPQTPAGVIHCDDEGNCIQSDAVASALCGMPEDMSGGGWLRCATVEDAAMLREKLKRAREMELAAIVEMQFSVPAGPPAWMRLIVVPLRNRFVITLQDVSVWKRVENRLGHAQKMEMMGRLTGGIVHDFNNVLTAIASCATKLQKEIPPGSAALRSAGRIGKLVDQAAAITRQFAAFSRKQAPAPQILDLNRVLRELEDPLLRTLAGSVQVKLLLEDPLHAVIADLAQMQQVILNLAVNACDAMPRRGTLSLSTTNVELTESFNGIQPGDYVMLQVADTGSGIPRAARKRLFEPFFTTKASGTGLGLSTVQRIVQQHGGIIEVESEPGQGSRFRIYLPSDLTQHRGRAAQLEARDGHETILLVEDAEAMRSALREMLQELGYAVLAAANGREALRIAKNRKFDLLLTDLSMPEVSGRELMKRLRGGGREFKAILMSGHATGPLQAAEPEAIFIQKPFQPEQLTALVRRVLDGSGE